MSPLPLNRTDILQQLFQPVGIPGSKKAPTNFGVVKGSLVSFRYTFWRNDATPLVIISDNNMNVGKLCGINLHYLTFPYIRQLLGMSANNPDFSYKSISGDDYVKKAYRSYKWSGVAGLRMMDHRFLLKVMNMVRSYDPAEVQIIRRQVQEQLRQQINPKASQITNLNQPEIGQNEIGG